MSKKNNYAWVKIPSGDGLYDVTKMYSGFDVEPIPICYADIMCAYSRPSNAKCVAYDRCTDIAWNLYRFMSDCIEDGTMWLEYGVHGRNCSIFSFVANVYRRTVEGWVECVATLYITPSKSELTVLSGYECMFELTD